MPGNKRFASLKRQRTTNANQIPVTITATPTWFDDETGMYSFNISKKTFDMLKSTIEKNAVTLDNLGDARVPLYHSELTPEIYRLEGKFQWLKDRGSMLETNTTTYSIRAYLRYHRVDNKKGGASIGWRCAIVDARATLLPLIINPCPHARATSNGKSCDVDTFAVAAKPRFHRIELLRTEKQANVDHYVQTKLRDEAEQGKEWLASGAGYDRLAEQEVEEAQAKRPTMHTRESEA